MTKTKFVVKRPAALTSDPGFDDPLPAIQYDPDSKRPLLPPFDWQVLCSQGHVLAHRFGAVIAHESQKATIRMVSAILFAIAAIGFVLLQSGSGAFQNNLARAVQPSESRIKVTAGADTLPWSLFWLPREFPHAAGMTESDWSKTVDAVASDVKANGAKVTAWRVVPALPGGGPLLTKPSRLFREWKDANGTKEPVKSELSKAGVVLVPEQAGDPISVAAVVTGNPAWVVIASNGCFIVAGPDRTGCKRGGSFDDYFDRLAPEAYGLPMLRHAAAK